MENGGELARVKANLAAQTAVARVLAEAPTLAEATPRLLDAIGRSLGWELGALWTIDAREDRLRCQSIWHAGPPAEEFERLSLEQAFAPGEGLPGRIWKQGRPLWIADVLAEEHFPRLQAAGREGLRGFFGFPIRNREQMLGVIEFFSREVRYVGEETLSLTDSFGYQIGQYLRRMQAEDAVRRSEWRKAGILESALDAIISIDHRGEVIEFNPAAERTFGYAREDVIGREMASLIIPPSLREQHRSALRRAVESGGGALFGRRLELTGLRASGEAFPVEITITRIEGEDPPPFTGYVRDITDRRRGEERASLLAEAGEHLSASSLDLEDTLRALAALCVPRVADWCVIDLVGRDGRLGRVAVAHVDPSKEALGFELERRYPTAAEGVPKAVRTGRSELLSDIPDELLEAVAQDPDHLRIIRELGFRSAMVVPLKARERRLGAMVFAVAESERRFDSEDLTFAEELARRAALAIDNARIHGERSRIAETLQASLLPPRLPDVPGVSVASRFRAAGEGHDVGGDFFDLFATGPGRWTLVVGDVSGKGPEAATVTALARYTVREAAAHEDTPSEVLERLNEAILSQQDDVGDRFCTALVGRLELTRAGARLTLSSGGHPLPLRLDGAGRVAPIGDPGMLLGVARDLGLHDVEVELDRLDSVLLYTDGVTETPTANGLLGEGGLAKLLAACGTLDAEGLVDHVDRTVLKLHAGEPRDDMAMLALQVQDASDGAEIAGLERESPSFAPSGSDGPASS
jgi:PAS domain S-box-containing protein